MCGWSGRPWSSLRRGHEQARRSEEQGEDQGDERDDDGLGGAHHQRGIRLQQADEEGSEDGPAQVTHPAHDDHDEGAQGEDGLLHLFRHAVE